MEQALQGKAQVLVEAGGDAEDLEGQRDIVFVLAAKRR